MGQKKIYGIVNLVTLGLTGMYFFVFYDGQAGLFESPVAGILAVTAIPVHMIKAARLYIAFYGRGISFGKYLEQYYKVIPVSMVWPLKLGDLFRAYCYGYQIRNYFAGVLIILMDRFVDSLALLTVMLVLNPADDPDITMIFYTVLVFLLFVILCYQLFPGMYDYWKKYFLLAEASAGRNRMLRMLERFHTVYREVSDLVRSRGALLYLLSFFAWVMEIGGLLFAGRFVLHQPAKGMAAGYLTAALTGGRSEYLEQYIMVSMIIMVMAYLSMVCLKIRKTGGGAEK